MASDRSLSSASPSSRAPHESPCLATAGAGSSCTTQWLLPSRSARPRERFSDLLTMIGGTTNLFGGVPGEFLGPQSWPFGAAVQHTGSLGIMCPVMRRQSGARRGRQRCRRRGHRDHGGQLQPTFRAEYGGLLRCTRCSRCLQASGRAGGRLDDSQAAWRARELRRRRPFQTPHWTPTVSAMSGLAGGRGGLPKRPHCACGRILSWHERICCHECRWWPLAQPAIATRRLPGRGGHTTHNAKQHLDAAANAAPAGASASRCRSMSLHLAASCI